MWYRIKKGHWCRNKCRRRKQPVLHVASKFASRRVVYKTRYIMFDVCTVQWLSPWSRAFPDKQKSRTATQEIPLLAILCTGHPDSRPYSKQEKSTPKILSYLCKISMLIPITPSSKCSPNLQAFHTKSSYAFLISPTCTACSAISP
jgi:hypothetical protein